MTDEMDRQLPQSKWRSWRMVVPVVLGTLLLAVTAAVLLANGAQRSLRVPAKTLSIGVVRQDVFHDFIPLNAKVVPRDVIFLDALEGGQVEKILIEAGDQVTIGQPIIVLRNTALELDVLDREGRLVEAITQLQTYEKTLEQNRADNERALSQIRYNILRLSRSLARREQLVTKGYLPQEQLDQVRDELALNERLEQLQVHTNRNQEDLRRKQLPRIRSELQTLQQSLIITRDKLEALVVKAPVTGRVTAIDLKVGQNRNRGERLAEITADTGFKVSVDIDEFYSGRVQADQIASIDFNGVEQRLSVSRVYPQVKDGRFVVDFSFVGPTPAGLLPGQAAQGRLALGSDRRALVLAAGPYLERSAGRWAFVLNPAGTVAERRPIKIGRRNVEQVEVLQGLTAGEKVVTSDYGGFENIDRIIIKK